MYKVRTAQKQFRGTCGHAIEPGTRFAIEEVRPVFSCHECAVTSLRGAMADLLSKTAAPVEAAPEEKRAQ